MVVQVLDDLCALARPRLRHEEGDGGPLHRVQNTPLVAVDGQPLLQHLRLSLCPAPAESRRGQIPVLRIHDILVWIRIRGSMHLNNGSGSSYFRHRPSRGQQKTNLKKIFCLLLFEGTITSFFKEIQKEAQNVGIYFFFLLFLLDDRRIRIHASD
jgi:hypothetical protein